MTCLPSWMALKAARTAIYYRNVFARESALIRLQQVMRESHHLKIADRIIHMISTYEPHVFGLDMPEPVMREAYIMLPGEPQLPQ